MLFVALGAPKQEKWIEEHKNDLLSTNVIKGLVHAFVLISKKKLFNTKK